MSEPGNRGDRVGDVLRRTAARIADGFAATDAGADGSPTAVAEQLQTARMEAEWLMEWATGWTRAVLLMHLPDTLSESESLRFERAVARRVSGEPIQYIVAAAAFYGRTFAVRPGCLIPRPETEILAAAAIELARNCPVGSLCADVGTGSGALAATLKLECPALRVVGIDVSAAALAIARENGLALGADVEWIEADGVDWLRSSGVGRLRLLISNPPYIPSRVIGGLARDVRDFEPRIALDGGNDGLDFYRSIADLGPGSFATGEAALLLEVGAGQANDVKALFVAAAVGQGSHWADWTFDVIHDLRGIARVVRGIRGGVTDES